MATKKTDFPKKQETKKTDFPKKQETRTLQQEYDSIEKTHPLLYIELTRLVTIEKTLRQRLDKLYMVIEKLV